MRLQQSPHSFISVEGFDLRKNRFTHEHGMTGMAAV
jgi:hypothetical protein